MKREAGKTADARGAALAAACLFLAVFPGLAPGASPDSEEYREEVSPTLGPDGPAADSAAPAASGAAASDTSKPRPGRTADSARTGAASADPLRPAYSPEPPLLVLPLLPGADDSADRPSLALLPTAGPGRWGGSRKPGSLELEIVTEALRLGAGQTRRFRVLTAEETARPFGRTSAVPGDCFSESCALRSARKVGADFLLVSEFAHPAPSLAALDSPDAVPNPAGSTLALALVDRQTGLVKKAVRARACPGTAGPIPFAQQAVWHLLLGQGPAAPLSPPASSDSAAPAAPADSAGRASGSGQPAPASASSCLILAEVASDSGPWRSIPWLNSRDTVDNRIHWSWAGSGLLAAALGTAWVQGQLLQEDENGGSPAGPLRSGAGNPSFLRGFFAVPNLGAQYAAMGGAGIAHVSNALAVIMNPAGVADAAVESAVASKRNLPDGSPSFHLSYAGPLAQGWHHGLGIQHEGDELANETTVQGILAGDWGAVARGLAGLKSGAAVKLYLAKVGEGGTGLDRSTGHSFGMGLDLGLRLRLSDRITGALSVRDAVSFLRHSNTFTDRTHWEMLPPEYRLGAAYQVSPAMLLVMDGQKGMIADQIDHVRFGAERILFGFFAVRGGLHQAFGRETVRKLALGFGLDSEGMSVSPRSSRVSINYAYDFGLDEDEPLGAGQQFSLEVSW